MTPLFEFILVEYLRMSLLEFVGSSAGRPIVKCDQVNIPLLLPTGQQNALYEASVDPLKP